MQELASKILKDNYPNVLIYVDDIIIMSNSLEEHIKTVNKILDKLTAANLRLNFDKCHFGFSCIQVLGHLLTGEERRPDPKKMDKLLKWYRPTTGKQVMSFLGFVNYLRDYVPNMSIIAAPLDKLRKLKVVTEDDWTIQCQEAFKTLKQVLANPPVLQTPLANVKMHVACDASQLGIGAVLYQIDENAETPSKKRYIAFASRSLNSGQRNYSATRRELLAVIFALQRFRYWLSDRHFILETDHRALIYMLHHTHTNYMLNAWMDVLLDFDFTVVHCPGISNVLADSLSRQYGICATLADPGGMHELLKAEEGVELEQLTHRTSRVSRMARRVRAETFGEHCIARKTRVKFTNKKKRKEKVIGISQSLSDPLPEGPTDPEDMTVDDFFDQRINNFTSGGRLSSPIRVNEWISRPEYEIAELVRDRLEKIVPPVDQRERMLDECHDRSGHRGAEFMYKHLWNDGYYWPGMKRDCTEVAAVCLPCLRWNIGKQGFHPMKGITASEPFRHIAVDLADYTHITSDEGYRFVLVIVDMFTKFVILRPIKDKSAITIVRELLDVGNLVGHFKILQTDNGTEFSNELLREYNSRQGSEHRLILPYHANANGAAENMVRQLKSIINKWMSGHVTQWPEKLSTVQYAINCNVTALTGTAPFTALFGRAVDSVTSINEKDSEEMNPITDLEQSNSSSSSQDTQSSEKSIVQEKILERGKVLTELVFPTIAKRILAEKLKMQTNADNTRRTVKRPLAMLTKVMLIDKLRKSKSQPGYIGPYQVVYFDARSNTYRLQGRDGSLLPRSYPLEYLKVINGNLRLSDTSTELVLEPRAYVVERVDSHRLNESNGEQEFFVKWKGYPISMNEWVPHHRFYDTNCLRTYFLELDAKKKAEKSVLGKRSLPLGEIAHKQVEQKKFKSRKGNTEEPGKLVIPDLTSARISDSQGSITTENNEREVLTEGTVIPSVDQVKNSMQVTAVRDASSNLEVLENTENEMEVLHHRIDDDQEGLEFPAYPDAVNGYLPPAQGVNDLQNVIASKNSSTKPLCESNSSSISYSVKSRSVSRADDSSSPMQPMAGQMIPKRNGLSEFATLVDHGVREDHLKSTLQGVEAEMVTKTNSERLLYPQTEAGLALDTNTPLAPLVRHDEMSTLDEAEASELENTDSLEKRLWVGQSNVENITADELSRVVLPSRLRKRPKRARNRHIQRRSRMT